MYFLNLIFFDNKYKGDIINKLVIKDMEIMNIKTINEKLEYKYPNSTVP